jgi:hypothetical protein
MVSVNSPTSLYIQYTYPITPRLLQSTSPLSPFTRFNIVGPHNYTFTAPRNRIKWIDVKVP